MSFPGLYNVAKETEEDWSATSSSLLTSSSEEPDDSDWGDDLEKVEIELSTEEMNTSSRGTLGWFHKHHILKSKRKEAEAKGISTSTTEKENAKEKPKRKHAAKSGSTLEKKRVSADGKEGVKAKLKRKNNSNWSLSSIIKADNKAKDHQYTAKKTNSFSALLNRGGARFSPPPRKRRPEVVSEQMHQCCLTRRDLSIRLSPLSIFFRRRRIVTGEVIMILVVYAAKS
jgi:hypothetical protein